MGVALRISGLLLMVATLVTAMILGKQKRSEPPADECRYSAELPADAATFTRIDVATDGRVSTLTTEGVATSGGTIVSTTVALSIRFKQARNGSDLIASNTGGVRVGFTGRTGEFCTLEPGKATYLHGAQYGLQLYSP